MYYIKIITLIPTKFIVVGFDKRERITVEGARINENEL